MPPEDAVTFAAARHQMKQLYDTISRQTKKSGGRNPFGGMWDSPLQTKLWYEEAIATNVSTVCSLGFGAGIDTVLWLSSRTGGDRRVVNFDAYPSPTASGYGQNVQTWPSAVQHAQQEIAVNALMKEYPFRFVPIAGDSNLTIPDFAARHPHFRCDLCIVDGAHISPQFYYDLTHMWRMAKPGTTLLVDDVDRDFLRGDLDRAHTEGWITAPQCTRLEKQPNRANHKGPYRVACKSQYVVPSPTGAQQQRRRLLEAGEPPASASCSLMVVVHPDDEMLFGGEALLEPGACWHVVCVTMRTQDRARDFTRTMRSIGNERLTWDHWLYTDPAKSQHLSGVFGGATLQLLSDLTHTIKQRAWRRVVTHNSQGEYGHVQHQALHYMMRWILQRLDGGLSRMVVFDPQPELGLPPSDAKGKRLLAYHQNVLKSHWNWTERLVPVAGFTRPGSRALALTRPWTTAQPEPLWGYRDVARFPKHMRLHGVEEFAQLTKSRFWTFFEDYDAVHALPDVYHALRQLERSSLRRTPVDDARVDIVTASFTSAADTIRDFRTNLRMPEQREHGDMLAEYAVASRGWRRYTRQHARHNNVLVLGRHCPRNGPRFCNAVAMLHALDASDAGWLLFRDLDAYVSPSSMHLSARELLSEVPNDCHVVIPGSLYASSVAHADSGFFAVRNTPLVREIVRFWWEQSKDSSRYATELDQASLQHTILHFINATRTQPPYYKDELATCHGNDASKDRVLACHMRFKQVLASWGDQHELSDDNTLRPFCRLNRQETNAFMCRLSAV